MPRRRPLAPVHGRARYCWREDADLTRNFIELLTEQGFAVVHARDGREALGIFRESPGPGEFSVILYGYADAGNGWLRSDRGNQEAAPATMRKAIADFTPAQPTTFKEDMDGQGSCQRGMNDFLTKANKHGLH